MMTTLPRNTILHGDALTVLQSLPDNAVHCCITSPPYYGLRNYDAEGQIGAEASPQEYIAALVEVFREMRRVLRKDGTFWLVIGDSYAGSMKGMGANGQSYGGPKQQTNKGSINIGRPDWSKSELKSKDLMMIPARVAMALQADGWYLRSDIIWEKPNAMPESVRDRPTTSHEHIFLFAKSEKYYYDPEAIAEPAVRPGDIQTFGGTKGRNYTPLPDDPNFRNGHEQWGRTIECGPTRNKRTVWSVSTRPFAGAHFATFPEKVVEPCVLAGTSPQACEQCGAPWKRVIERTGHINQREPAHVPRNSATKTDSTGWAPLTRATDTFRPTCLCPQTVGSGKGLVLDPFCGAGTVPLVARRHGREYLGIELNPSYILLAEKRVGTACVEEVQEAAQEPILPTMEEAPLRKKLTITLLPKVVRQSQQPA